MISIHEIIWYILGTILLYLFLQFQINKIRPTKPKSYKKAIEDLKNSVT